MRLKNCHVTSMSLRHLRQGKKNVTREIDLELGNNINTVIPRYAYHSTYKNGKNMHIK